MKIIEKNGILYPERKFRCDTPDWEHFMGNNHNCITNIDARWGGGLHVKEHLGKPLSNKLWMDLVGRLGVKWMRIYNIHDWQWADGPCRGSVHIYLDDDKNVVDFHLYL